MGIYHGAEKVLIDLWVKQQLATKSVALNAISGGLSDRIFYNNAEPDTLYPFIVYQCMNPPRDIRGVGIARIITDATYIVKAVSQGATDEVLGPIVSTIDDAMTTNQAAEINSGVVYASVRERQFSMTERDNGVDYQHLGGEYFIVAQG